ncbi:hypothetical protein G6321_00053350 [Bradyrhizobium barranii subsp. barranii]|uniref:Uncharacterized protein n=1 Tax=Bradyrhizobium barranii subsp. barranii TaxID=2823807 RepID=A0A9X9YTI7_9BRAD|nr:hypothetical protein [Bradyrhizobium barranii]UGX94242.1 hypothetical protein G6321_00053350 [Bradyrhizobium barranii subsp. barranii]
MRNARRDDFEIASTLVPAGTLVPPKADLGRFKAASCGAHLCLELSAVGPDGVEDDSHFASNGNLRLFGADPFGQLAAPALEGRTSPDNGQQDVRGFEQISPNLMVAAFGDAASSVDLAGLITSWCQAEIGTDVGGMSEASGVVDGNAKARAVRGPIPGTVIIRRTVWSPFAITRSSRSNFSICSVKQD